MNFKEYQEKANETAIYPTTSTPNDNVSYVYPLIGLSGEVGELCNKLKKNIRDGMLLDSDDLKAELGDVLWYVAVLASELNLNLQDVAEHNIKKLADRKDRGVIGGDGDNR